MTLLLLLAQIGTIVCLNCGIYSVKCRALNGEAIETEWQSQAIIHNDKSCWAPFSLPLSRSQQKLNFTNLSVVKRHV